MEKFNVWKILAVITMVFCLGCTGPQPHTGKESGAGTGTGGTETDSSGTGNATSGAGTGTGGTGQ